MLAAYYDKSCDSSALFQPYKISASEHFQEHLNQYDVIYLDINSFRTSANAFRASTGFVRNSVAARETVISNIQQPTADENVVSGIQQSVIGELTELYPACGLSRITSLPLALATIHKMTGVRFVIIIDEWDAIFREEKDQKEAQADYLHLLRGLFKDAPSKRFIKLAYLTGILPIKKYGTESALNNFDEFTMLDAGSLASYAGFTEDEVKALCQTYGRDFTEVKYWYDGYLLREEHIYNPKAVVSVMLRGTFKSYWSMTGTYESILPLINMNFDGLKTDLIKMLAGEQVEIEVSSFQNDMVTFADKDDVLTLLIHMGYLAYDEARKTTFIPNEEIRSEFAKATKRKKWNELIELQIKSEELLQATWEKDSETVADIIEKIHMDYTSAIQYHNENSLSSVLSIAYLSAMQYYFKPIRELPTGKGFADLVFLPKKEFPELPAMIVELKWNQSADTAIQQIKERHYTRSLEEYAGTILAVGINYDKKTKKHTCKIEVQENGNSKSSAYSSDLLLYRNNRP